MLTLEMGVEHLPPKLHAVVTNIGHVRGAPTAQGPAKKKGTEEFSERKKMYGLIFINPQGNPAVGYAMIQQEKFGLQISSPRKKKINYVFSFVKPELGPMKAVHLESL